MKPFIFALLPVFCAAGSLHAQSVVTEPIGFNKVTCLSNSDTVVGVPLRKEGSQSTALSGNPIGTGDSITLPVTATLTAGQFSNHYAKFVGGAKDGSWYDITAHTTDSITVDLNGDSLTGVTSGDAILIAEYWTLNTLFPPAEATETWTETPAASGNWVPDGHAVVASTNTLPTGRHTEIRMPNLTEPGTNIPPEGRYFVHGTIWKRSGSGSTDYGSTIIFPNTLFTISHTSLVSHQTTYRTIGEVELGTTSIPLTTQDDVAQDNFIGIPRPLPLTLDELNLRQSPGAFMASTNTLPTGRRDQLLIYDNELQRRNKAPSAIYYVHNGIWKLSGGGNTDRSNEIIPASAGFIIRKFQVPGHPTAFWNNTSTY
ncbi:MAG: TIGR02597 family protein [Akkermansiaceae bacterium]|nr:TIGR02597 family protein [Akkermansiaceae bacterium]MCF7732733.1 TIGR02597 family protein [Akkermansiaceae bacterium]